MTFRLSNFPTKARSRGTAVFGGTTARTERDDGISEPGLVAVGIDGFMSFACCGITSEESKELSRTSEDERLGTKSKVSALAFSDGKRAAVSTPGAVRDPLRRDGSDEKPPSSVLLTGGHVIDVAKMALLTGIEVGIGLSNETTESGLLGREQTEDTESRPRLGAVASLRSESPVKD